MAALWLKKKGIRITPVSLFYLNPLYNDKVYFDLYIYIYTHTNGNIDKVHKNNNISEIKNIKK